MALRPEPAPSYLELRGVPLKAVASRKGRLVPQVRDAVGRFTVAR